MRRNRCTCGHVLHLPPGGRITMAATMAHKLAAYGHLLRSVVIPPAGLLAQLVQKEEASTAYSKQQTRHRMSFLWLAANLRVVSWWPIATPACLQLELQMRLDTGE